MRMVGLAAEAVFGRFGARGRFGCSSCLRAKLTENARLTQSHLPHRHLRQSQAFDSKGALTQRRK
ncbi:hypothetical protein [Reyranella sp.]|uniref:hypothetical protein n=1 Tax=Reyranella sp. TaxID=1929291 RepID=UPI003D0AAF04